MPVVIEELSASFEIQDEVKIRRLVRDEIERFMAQKNQRSAGASGSNPADPGASGRPDEGTE